MKKFVAILMGSDSDLPVMESTINVLQDLGIAFEVRISSAHRTPQRTQEYIHSAEGRGAEIFICAAGMAAHLAGCVAAHTTKPVIGVPLASGHLEGWDALLSTAQMPGGIPVATVAVGKAGATNAGWLAAQMLAISDSTLSQKIKQAREKQAQAVMAKDEALQARFS